MNTCYPVMKARILLLWNKVVQYQCQHSLEKINRISNPIMVSILKMISWEILKYFFQEITNKWFSKLSYFHSFSCNRRWIHGTTWFNYKQKFRSWTQNKCRSVHGNKETVNCRKGKDIRISVSNFFSMLPKLECHYCRSTSSKQYLEPHWQSKAALYKQYEVFCKENQFSQASIKVFMDVFEEKN